MKQLTSEQKDLAYRFATDLWQSAQRQGSLDMAFDGGQVFALLEAAPDNDDFDPAWGIAARMSEYASGRESTRAALVSAFRSTLEPSPASATSPHTTES